MKEVRPHPISEVFPSMRDEEFEGLVQSIREHGLKQKIILYEGKILDGRHRYRACLKAGVEPKFEQYKGPEPVELVVSANIHRRHLDDAQRAMAAAKLAELRLKRLAAEHKKADLPPIGGIQEAAAEEFNASVRSVERAARVQAASPKIAEQVAEGKLSLSAAEKVVKEQQKKKEDPVVRDKVGRKIPAEMQAIWERREEPMRYMKELARMENELKERQQAKDEVFSVLNYSDVISRLQYLHMVFKQSQLWALCPSCQGRGRQNCAHCKGRGFLSQFAWSNVPDKELIIAMSK